MLPATSPALVFEWGESDPSIQAGQQTQMEVSYGGKRGEKDMKQLCSPVSETDYLQGQRRGPKNETARIKRGSNYFHPQSLS